MLTSAEVKAIAMGLGADLCGIAPVARWAEAPAAVAAWSLSRAQRQ